MHPLIHLGPLLVPTYYLLISLGSIAGIIWFLRRTPSNDEAAAINLAFVVLIAGFAGARLLHILFEAPQVYAENPWLVLRIWEGGFVFYGGMIGAFTAAYYYCRYRALDWPVWLDRAALPAGLAYAIGRLGCFFNGCCYGKVCSLSWAVQFPIHATWGLTVLPRHPTQIYASALELLNIVFLASLERKRVFTRPGELFCCWLLIHALNRLIVEYWRGDDRGSLVMGFSISSLISLVLAGLALRMLFRYRTCKTSTQSE